MLLAVDVGNSQTVAGLFSGGELLHDWRISTIRRTTVDELAAIADPDTFAQLPWDPRVARVFCDCYDTETGDLLEADPRQNLKRIVNEVEAELGLGGRA